MIFIYITKYMSMIESLRVNDPINHLQLENRGRCIFPHGEVIHHGCIMASIANQLYTIWLDMLRMCMYIMYNALQGKLRYPRIHVWSSWLIIISQRCTAEVHCNPMFLVPKLWWFMDLKRETSAGLHPLEKDQKGGVPWPWGYLINSWCVMENPMRHGQFGGSPTLGNPDMHWRFTQPVPIEIRQLEPGNWNPAGCLHSYSSCYCAVSEQQTAPSALTQAHRNCPSQYPTPIRGQLEEIDGLQHIGTLQAHFPSVTDFFFAFLILGPPSGWND